MPRPRRPPDVRITSPTFSLVHEFRGKFAIRHADLYRIETARDLVELGLDAARDDGALLIVEWGERYLDALGGDAVVVTVGLDPRHAIVTATGKRSLAIVDALGRRPS